MRRWLQAQGLMTAPVLALFFAAPANFLLNWLLVWGPWEKIRIGFVGAPIATAVSINVMVSSLPLTLPPILNKELTIEEIVCHFIGLFNLVRT